MCPGELEDCFCEHGSEALRLDCSGKDLNKLPTFAATGEVILKYKYTYLIYFIKMTNFFLVIS